MKYTVVILSFLFSISSIAQKQYKDDPFTQDYADKYDLSDELKNKELLQVRSNRNEFINIVSEGKLLQTGNEKLVKDNLYRPFEAMNIVAIDRYKEQLVYLTDVAVLSNAWSGDYYVNHGLENPTQFVLGKNFSTLVAKKGKLVLFENGKEAWAKSITDFNPIKLLFDEKEDRFLMLTNEGIYQLLTKNNTFSRIYEGTDLTAITLHKNDIVVGSKEGVLSLDTRSFVPSEINKKLPYNEITSLANINGELWFGSKNGAFKLREDGKYDYYASKRWLVDNDVVDISVGPDNSVLVLTTTGLSKINFVEITLEEKAAYFQEIQRSRHIRYGFTGNLSLQNPGDVYSGVMHDTDNDGLWTSMYLAGELFRYAVTKSEDAKLNAYEAFAAMERLEGIAGLSGFPARAFEREGVELGEGSNGFTPAQIIAWNKEHGSTWQFDETGRWKWKVSTSSDETCGHFFVYALFAELAPDQEWKDRAIRQIKLQMDHIIKNDWHLVTWNGKPTRWGNWSPEYVNSFPINVGDRRLNSTLILAFLQTAYHFTGDELYKKKAYKLIKKYGYDDNANRPASVIGHVEGEYLSDTWNHSDDQMYFLTIPAFVNYSFTEKEKEKHFEAAKSHWEIERSEKNPVWNFLYAMTGGTDYDLEDSVWWLQEFPLDLVSWTIDNTKRNDLEKLEPNFRRQTYKEVLPPDEQPVHFHNGAYRNNSNGAGMGEEAPYIWLLPYWAGRYVGALSGPEAE